MIKAILCALFGHQPDFVRWAVTDLFMDGDGRSLKEERVRLRPCTRCPVFIEVESILKGM